MDLGIRGRRALVFGGSRGVGRAVAGALAAEGAHLAVCARKGWAAQRVASENVERSGVNAAGYRIEGWDAPSTVALVSRITEDFGDIDLLFGVARSPAPGEGRAPSWETRLGNGFLGFRAATETLVHGMQRRGWGRVLWMIPWAAPETDAERQAHCVAGAALSAWLRSVAAGVAGDNVTLNVLLPAQAAGPRGSDARRSRGETRPEADPASGGGTPSATPRVAAVAAFLLSDLAGGLCGQTFDLRGAASPSASPRAAPYRPGGR